MKDKVNILKIMNYQINPLLLKGIKYLKIEVNELLLIIYFININNILDLKDIKDKTNLNEEEILNSYSSLLSKGLIETKVDKSNGKLDESILLDNLYNKIVLDGREETVNKDIFSKFENEFGRSLSPIEYETINTWLSKGVKEDIIYGALKEAVINNATSLRYIDRIIYDWTKKGFNPKEESEYKDQFDYNWLEDEDFYDE